MEQERSYRLPGSGYAGAAIRSYAASRVPPRGILLVFLATFCAFLTASVVASQWLDRVRRLEGANREASMLDLALEEQTLGVIRATDQALLGIAESVRRNPFLKKHDPAFEASLRRLLGSLPAVRALFVAGPDGVIRQDTDRDTPQRNLSDRGYFGAQADESAGGLFVGKPLVSRSTGHWFIALSRRLETLDGAFAGVVVAAVDVAYFESFYGGLDLGEGDVITLATRDLVLVARAPRAGARIGEPLVPGSGNSTLERALARSPVGTFEATSMIDGTDRLYAYRVLPNYPLIVLVGLSMEGVLGPWRVSAYGAAGATAGAIGIAVFLWWLSIRYSRREAAAQAAAAEASKLEAIGRTTSGVAHDFNNLLAAMQAALRLLSKRIADDPDAAKLIEQGHSVVEQGRSLVAQLLTVARQGVEPRDVDVNAALAGMATLLNTAAASKARVEMDLAPDLDRCRIDPSRFDAAILNLVVNACDAMPADRESAGVIRISSANRQGPIDSGDGRTIDGALVSVTVSDNGLGMPAEVRRRVFEPFFTTKGEHGTGLGLPQVSAFVREMGGAIRIESERGKGTAVHLYFPRAADCAT